jgi:hypothetical protein
MLLKCAVAHCAELQLYRQMLWHIVLSCSCIAGSCACCACAYPTKQPLLRLHHKRVSCYIVLSCAATAVSYSFTRLQLMGNKRLDSEECHKILLFCITLTSAKCHKWHAALN